VNELALFAGAGGGILGGHLLGWRCVCAVEYNAYARSVLLARQNDGTLPPFPIWDDVRTFDGRPWRGNVDIISGGFPCQAYSTAAAGKNNADDLWPEMRRIVADVAPRYVFAENVSPKAINAAADDLEEMGYKPAHLPLARLTWVQTTFGSGIGYLHTPTTKANYCADSMQKWPSARGISPSVWQTYPDESRMVDGLANRMERFSATGNGQVPIVAATAWRLLSERAGVT
jgi:DNA (cytosine-5)-methyltransferase 1